MKKCVQCYSSWCRTEVSRIWFCDNPAHQKRSRSGVHLFSQIKRVFDIEDQSSRQGGELSAGSLRSSAWSGDSLTSGLIIPYERERTSFNSSPDPSTPRASQTSRTAWLLHPLHSCQTWNTWRSLGTSGCEAWRDWAEKLPLMKNCDGSFISTEPVVCCFSRVTTSRSMISTRFGRKCEKYCCAELFLSAMMF